MENLGGLKPQEIILYELGQIKSTLTALVLKYEEKDKKFDDRLSKAEGRLDKFDAKVNWIAGATAVLGVIAGALWSVGMKWLN